MPGIDRILSDIRSAPPDGVVTLAEDGAGLIVRTGRLAKWTATFALDANRRVHQQFFQSLNDRFGPAIGNHVATTSTLYLSNWQGTPLRVREIREHIRWAEQLLEHHQKHNVAANSKPARPSSAQAAQPARQLVQGPRNTVNSRTPPAASSKPARPSSAQAAQPVRLLVRVPRNTVNNPTPPAASSKPARPSSAQAAQPVRLLVRVPRNTVNNPTPPAASSKPARPSSAQAAQPARQQVQGPRNTDSSPTRQESPANCWLVRLGRAPTIKAITSLVYPPGRLDFRLQQEIDRSAEWGYVGEFLVSGDPTAAYEMLSDENLLRLLTVYNDTMKELHQTFPRLRSVPPPNFSLASGKKLDGSNPHNMSTYVTATGTMQLYVRDYQSESYAHDQAKSANFYGPTPFGLRGQVLFHFAEHLASEPPGYETDWISKLIDLLKQRGFISEDTEINPHHLMGLAFSVEVGKNVREMGLGIFAGQSLDAFAAEALTWRLSPGYGQSTAIPRMPRDLENWVHECFPVTRDGPIPPVCHRFDPDTVPEPWWNGKEITWRPRNEPPEPPLPSAPPWDQLPGH